MGALRQGDREAGRELVDLCYPELRRMAAAKMRSERTDHTLQPTALVHELYLELLKIRGLRERTPEDDERAAEDDECAAFFGLAGHMMKRLLIHHSRPLYRRAEHVELGAAPEPASGSQALHDVEDALAQLGLIDPKLRAVVELRVFEGLTGDEIAERMGCSRRTATNYWNVARQWLQKEWAGAPG